MAHCIYKTKSLGEYMVQKQVVKDWKAFCLTSAMPMRDQLEKESGVVPTIREVLYRLVDAKILPDRVGDYNQLTTALGKLRDYGAIPFGLFSSEAAGEAYTPYTDTEIDTLLGFYKAHMRASLQNNIFHCILVEKVKGAIQTWTDGKIPIASCQGNIRREFLHSEIERWIEVCKDLGGEKVKILYLGDWDRHGKTIANTIIDKVKLWFRNQVSIDVFAVLPKHMTAIGRTYADHIHLDGFIASYGYQKFRSELRKAVGL